YTLESRKVPEITREEVVKKYREFIDYATGEPMYGNAVKRLADIELESAEQDNMLDDPKRAEIGRRKMEAAVRMYLTYLDTYPHRENTDLILYQLAKAYELIGDHLNTLKILTRLVDDHPHSRHFVESQFRRGEMLFVLRKYRSAEKAYQQIIQQSSSSVFYEKSLYKYGWSLFKQSKYEGGLNAFFKLLDIKANNQLLLASGPAKDLSRAESDIQTDTIRGVSLSFSYIDGAKGIKKYFAKYGNREYEPVIYRALAKTFESKERFKDAADTYLAYGEHYPNSELAPVMHQDAIEVYKKSNLPTLQLATKEQFINKYNINSRYWNTHKPEQQAKLKPLLQKHLAELAQHYHAVARKTQKKNQKLESYRKAIAWYDTYIKAFPTEANTVKINFLLAEAYNETRQYNRAVVEFEKAAYDYPQHPKSAESAYAALLTYTKLIKLNLKNKTALADLRKKNTISALRFGERFPHDQRLASVLSNTAEQLYTMRDYPAAIATAERVLVASNKNKKLDLVAYSIIGHAKFDQKDYVGAETAYSKLLAIKVKRTKHHKKIESRLAASIYKQGEKSKADGDLKMAAHHFLRLSHATPNSTMRINAEYDAATVLIEQKDFKKAEDVLNKFRRRYPKQKKLQLGVTEKLAYIFSQTGQKLKAAKEIERMASLPGKNTAYRQARLWEAAGLYQDSGQGKKAATIYKNYIKKFPRKYPESIEARYQLAMYYKSAKQPREQIYWLKETIQAEKQAKTANTDRTRFLAAQATLTMAYPLMASYRKTPLKIPLKKSLKKKKRLMEKTILAYKNAMKYKVADVSTSATYHIAEVYHDFSRSLMKSQRPKGLSAIEKEQYNLLLEEQAFPFEEKAIDIHIANTEFVKQGIYDKWVKNSLKQLEELQPIRYAKTEKSEPYVEAIH
ncbi:MAG: tetratricopeptide repeat protein, partial [Gammaproteobacteria bacterium]|nr:tetratricopeptide repeat protein [Gammaproteobacteria bacterium]